MKTIRTNTFETNSSSTHSVTVGPKGGNKDKTVKPLVENGILYPNRLKGYVNSPAYDCEFLVCDTTDKKAAIVLSWVCSAVEYGDAKFLEETLKQAADIIKELCGYSDIDIESINSDFYGSSECGENYSNRFVDDESFNAEEFRSFVKSSVINDEIEIVDTTTPQ
jgi:hypothetical protein